MDEYPRRSKNSYLREAITMQAQFLQTVYDLAECKDLSQDEQNKVLEIAANTKDALPILEGLMGKDNKKKPEEDDTEKDEDGDDEFVESLLDGLPKRAKVVKIIKGAKA